MNSSLKNIFHNMLCASSHLPQIAFACISRSEMFKKKKKIIQTHRFLRNIYSIVVPWWKKTLSHMPILCYLLRRWVMKTLLYSVAIALQPVEEESIFAYFLYWNNSDAQYIAESVFDMNINSVWINTIYIWKKLKFDCGR